MKSIVFIAIVLLSGAIAGSVHGAANLVIVEPYLDEAIGIENQNLFASGEAEDTPEFWIEYSAYRGWQKGGQLLAGAILGTSMGSLFGIVFAFSKNVLPGNNYVKKSLVLAGIMWTTIFIIPFLKYPANPPTVGDPETLVLRSILFVSFIVISGLGAIGFYQLYKRIKTRKKILAFIGYGIFIGIVYFMMPPNPDEISAPMDLVNGFRAMSFITVSIFWLVVGITLGVLWHKFDSNLHLSPKA